MESYTTLTLLGIGEDAATAVCLSACPGVTDCAIPVAIKKLQNKLFNLQLSISVQNLLGPETGTLETVAVGCTTLATLLMIAVPLSESWILVLIASHSALNLFISVSISIILK